MSGFNNTKKLSFKLLLHRINGHNKPWNKASSTRKYETSKKDKFFTLLHDIHVFMEVSIYLACFYRTSYPSFPGRVCRSAPPVNVPLLLFLPRAHCLWQAVGMLCRQESLLDGCASGVTACRRMSITSSSGVRIMFYSKLVEYLTSCS